MLLIILGPVLFASGNNLSLFLKELAPFGVYSNINYSEEILMHYLYGN